jgi:hypothetical protein
MNPSSPSSVSPSPKKRKVPRWLPILGAAVTVVCCGGVVVAALTNHNSNTPSAAAPANTDTSQPNTGTSSTAAAQPTSEICRFNADGGAYYLLVTSATDHNFTACLGAVQYDEDSGDIDKLLSDGTGIDRRCILGTAATVRFDALVGVYSSPAAADMSAARAFCDAYGTQ